MRRRRGGIEMEGPDVPVAPMLDMAFQLLTFFVLTYRAAPVEGQFVMNLLPPQPATAMAAAPADAAASNELPATLRTLPVVLRADDAGRLVQVNVADVDVSNDPAALQEELDRHLQDPDSPFDQTLIKVDPNLRYAELMTVIDAFTNAFIKAKKEPKLSFDELRGDEGG
ncbi:ExbD/TolR family protein [Paludisphaera soli]|uniref:ExbD/TolR family protein n=1 Tax=Paludisphaera soli TaxID=2712865 RepID=UPI001F10E437|nr:biopolymer transporter ExbD [Paludisphaera soli]